jgi:hypothetical protein
MWIRSQDRLSLVPNPRLKISISNQQLQDDKKVDWEEKSIFAIHNETHIEIGTYKTKERALKILDKIQRAIANSETAHYIYGDYDTNRQYGIISTSKYNIYTMPKD